MIIELLKQKKGYLAQFSWLSAKECQRLKTGDFSRINQFYRKRQEILKDIAKTDTQIQTYKESHLSSKEKTFQQKTEIDKLLKETRRLACFIVQQELLIHCYIDKQPSSALKNQSA